MKACAQLSALIHADSLYMLILLRTATVDTVDYIGHDACFKWTLL